MPWWRARILVPVLAALPAAAKNDDATTITLPNGVVMPIMSAGTWQYNDTEAETSVEAAISVGFKHVDTANDYGNQEGVSAGLEASGVARNDVFITTKVPGCGAQGVDKDACHDSTAQFLADDVKQLNSSYNLEGFVDLVLLHFPPCAAVTMAVCEKARSGCDDCTPVVDQWQAMVDAYTAGTYRAIGVSNYCEKCLKCLDGFDVKPMINQVQLHVGMGPDPQGIISTNQARGIVTQAWSPLGSGGHGSDDILYGNLTTAIAAAHNVSTAQVALKYLVQKGAAVATKSSSAEHLAEDIDMFSWELTDAEMSQLDADSAASGDTPSFMCDNN